MNKMKNVFDIEAQNDNQETCTSWLSPKLKTKKAKGDKSRLQRAARQRKRQY